MNPAILVIFQYDGSKYKTSLSALKKDWNFLETLLQKTFKISQNSSLKLTYLDEASKKEITVSGEIDLDLLWINMMTRSPFYLTVLVKKRKNKENKQECAKKMSRPMILSKPGRNSEAEKAKDEEFIRSLHHEMKQFFKGIYHEPEVKKLLKNEYHKILAENPPDGAEKAVENLKKNILEGLKGTLMKKSLRENQKNLEVQEEEKKEDVNSIGEFEALKSRILEEKPECKDSIAFVMSMFEMIISKNKQKGNVSKVIEIENKPNVLKKKFVLEMIDGKFKMLVKSVEAVEVEVQEIKEKNKDMIESVYVPIPSV